MNHLKRTFFGLLTAAVVVVALLYLPLSIVTPVMILLVAAVHLEFSQMVAKKYAILTRLGVVAGVAYVFTRVCPFGDCPSCPCNVVIPAALFFILALRTLFGKSAKPVEELATTALGFLYVPMMLAYFVLIPNVYGMATLLYVIAMVKFSDMGGFAIGILFGRHKMCPTISPKKSWEGLGGSIAAGILMSLAFLPLTHYTPVRAVAFGVAAALVGTLGDLVESRMKREIGVKDSATFMPAGMGGFLDMFDSLVFAPALLYPFLGA